MQVNKIRNVDNINLNQKFERSLIKKGAVLNCLKKSSVARGAIEISMELDVSTFYVRQELNRLVEEGLIRIEQAPAQGKLHSCDLVYSYIDSVYEFIAAQFAPPIATDIAMELNFPLNFVEQEIKRLIDKGLIGSDLPKSTQEKFYYALEINK